MLRRKLPKLLFSVLFLLGGSSKSPAALAIYRIISQPQNPQLLISTRQKESFIRLQLPEWQRVYRFLFEVCEKQGIDACPIDINGVGTTFSTGEGFLWTSRHVLYPNKASSDEGLSQVLIANSDWTLKQAINDPNIFHAANEGWKSDPVSVAYDVAAIEWNMNEKFEEPKLSNDLTVIGYDKSGAQRSLEGRAITGRDYYEPFLQHADQKIHWPSVESVLSFSLFTQVKGEVSPGWSGSPILDSRGVVVGILTSHHFTATRATSLEWAKTLLHSR